MAHPSIVIDGNVYPTVPSIVIPKSGGGTAEFTDTFETANATASTINVGSSAYVAGVLVEGSQVIQTFYTGSGNPSSSLGSNGDIYLKVV